MWLLIWQIGSTGLWGDIHVLPWMRANRWTLFSFALQRHLAEWHIISCCKKLGNFGISSALLNWFKDYLTDREQRVVIEGMNSTWWAHPSGVPQGSLLGPFFFVIFISDLLEVVMPGNCVSLYADDCKTSRIINCLADHSVFQSNLDNLCAWGQQNLMEFNVKKFKLMHITNRKTPIHSDLHLNNNILELTSELRNLGLVTVCDLSWSTHIDKISNTDNKILGLIKRICKGFQDVSTLRTLYLALVRSLLECCSVVWSPQKSRKFLSWSELGEGQLSLFWRPMMITNNEEKGSICCS